MIYKIDSMSATAMFKQHEKKKVMLMGLFNMPFSFYFMIKKINSRMPAIPKFTDIQNGKVRYIHKITIAETYYKDKTKNN